MPGDSRLNPPGRLSAGLSYWRLVWVPIDREGCMEGVSVSARPPRFARVSLIVLCLLTLLRASASAQAVYGSIGGTIKDPSGAVLPGVNVTITSIGRQTSD